jgi:hypothetical protein
MISVQTVKDMGTPKNIAIPNWDRVMSDVSSVVEIILQITREVRSTKTYKIKRTHLTAWNNTPLPHKSKV